MVSPQVPPLSLSGCGAVGPFEGKALATAFALEGSLPRMRLKVSLEGFFIAEALAAYFTLEQLARMQPEVLL